VLARVVHVAPPTGAWGVGGGVSGAGTVSTGCDHTLSASRSPADDQRFDIGRCTRMELDHAAMITPAAGAPTSSSVNWHRFDALL